ncbi:acetamidase/formamidase family protein [Chloroflexota bacterium]
MAFHRFQPQIYYFTYGPNDPALIIHDGDTVVTTTRDARGLDEKLEPIPETQKQNSDITSLRQSNPLVGPIYVEEIKRRDTLAVTIKTIRLNRDSAWSGIAPNLGALTRAGPGKTTFLNEPLPAKRFEWRLNLERNEGILELENSEMKRIAIPLHPFIGSIGIAPRYGRVEPSNTPGEYGGNMDCVETKEGTTIYFPVWVDGAYLAFGDVHAAQGDGELCGSALETTAEVTIQLDIIKNRKLEWPHMQDDKYLMTTGSGRPLIDCVRVAYIELVKWLVDEHGYDKWDAYQMVSQVGTMRIGNIVNPNYTVVAKFPKEYLKYQ